LTSGVSDTRSVAAPAGPAPAAAPPATGATTALVFATAPAGDGGCAALLPWGGGTVLGRLVSQLADLGLRDIHVVTRPAWQGAVGATAGATVHASPDVEHDLRLAARIADGDGGMVVLYGDIVTHRGALAGLIADPRLVNGVLVGSRRRLMTYRVRGRRGRVISAASSYHAVAKPTAAFLGAVKVAPADRAALATAAGQLAPLRAQLTEAWQDELARKEESWRAGLAARAAGAESAPEDESDSPTDAEADPAPEEEAVPRAAPLSDLDEARLAARVAAAHEDAVALLLVGLVRSGAPIGQSYLRKLFWARPLTRTDIDRAAEEIQGYDEDKVLLDSAVKGSDGFFTTFFVSPYSKYIARWCARRGFTPNQVTTVSLGIGFAAAAAFATGERWGLVLGAVLLQLAFTTDCVDGQLARYTKTFSKLGAWLDSIFDRSKEYLAFAGLAIGASRAGDPVWLLACAVLTLQTVRHLSDFSFAGVQHQAIGETKQQPLEEPFDSGPRSPQAAAAEAAPEQPLDEPATPVKPPLARRVLSRWHAIDRARSVRWIKRMIAFPIGERFAVISITAALFDARVTFISLLVLGGIAAVYTQTGRVLRSIAR
jgi:hypothetical protein